MNIIPSVAHRIRKQYSAGRTPSTCRYRTDINTVMTADSRKSTLKKAANPSTARRPAEMVVSTPANARTAPPDKASVPSVVPRTTESRRGSSTSTTSTNNAPAVSRSSGSR